MDIGTCKWCSAPIGIGAATIYDGNCSTECQDSEAVVTYDDIIEAHDQAIEDSLKELTA